jgi:hypothetical protein
LDARNHQRAAETKFLYNTEKHYWIQIKAVQNGEISPFAAAQCWKNILKVNLFDISFDLH